MIILIKQEINNALVYLTNCQATVQLGVNEENQHKVLTSKTGKHGKLFKKKGVND